MSVLAPNKVSWQHRGETSAANMTSAPVHVVQEGGVEVDLVQPSNSPMEALKGTSTTTSAQEHGNSDELVEQQNSMSIIEGGEERSGLQLHLHRKNISGYLKRMILS